ncbi:cyclopropane-fatty-acyl-phospholipid synthase [Penicillium angulare]|uniref:cyclopropane-fatty-acyl-phospholipid synthase n=1 Tax=Penicillium angulare TaxID=116970 RepID=UPI00254258C8|nr:cyclopropane-fatty-acyl-phospholipid synthase [Penicillium angulare]KAJ5280080.1 cyclopropane-fatty-acyl-phospholipid synthase [Penicillium angulare]
MVKGGNLAKVMDHEALSIYTTTLFGIECFFLPILGSQTPFCSESFRRRTWWQLFKVFIFNERNLSGPTTRPYQLISTVSDLLFRTFDTGTFINVRLNITAAYDLSNEMFEAFLSPDMTYSCPIYLERTDPNFESDTLEAAQMRKLDKILASVNAQPTGHILELGTGWGSMCIRAATTIGCKVTTCTLSEMQYQLARKRVKTLGLEDKITIHLCDYRLLPMPETPYDKIVSVEMMEAMGDHELETMWATIDRVLKPRGGICSIQTTTMPESRYKNMFPKGEGLLEAVQKSNAQLDLDSVVQYGSHYGRCLLEWNQKFQANYRDVISPLLREKYQLSDEDLEIFYRKYVYYFEYTAAGFETKALSMSHVTFSRPGTLALLQDV